MAPAFVLRALRVKARKTIAEIGLRTDDQAGNAWAMVVDFREPFFTHVLERCGGGDTEANQEDVPFGGRLKQPCEKKMFWSKDELSHIRVKRHSHCCINDVPFGWCTMRGVCCS